MHHVLRDVRHSLRLLARAPGFTAVAVLILALGIGANTAVFSVVNTLVLQPRPERIDSLVGVFNRDRSRPDRYRDFSYPAYVDLRDRSGVFDSLAAHGFALVGIRDGGDATRRSFAAVVSANYFSTLGVRIAAGRPFTAEEERPGAGAAVAIASYSAWQRSGLDPSFVGSLVRVNGAEFMIVGVAPRGFAGTMTLVSPEWWFPLGAYDAIVNEMFRQRATGLTDRGNHALNLIGALAPDVARQAAAERLEAFALRLGEEFPATDRDRSFVLAGVPRLSVSSEPQDDGELRSLAGLLMLMSALVLVVACLNLANLLLARGATRRREIAVRQALGSGRARFVQQLLVEGFTLSVIGASAGLVVCWWATTALAAWLAGILPLGIELVVGTSPRTLAAAGAFAMFSTILFALGPAWRLSRPAVTSDLKGEPGPLGRRFRTGAVLVAGQLAVSLALVAAGGLFMRAAIEAAGANPGFPLDRQLVVTLDPSLAGYDEGRTRAAYRAVLDRVRSMAGVEQASLASIVAFGEMREGGTVTLPNRDLEVGADFTIVTSGYFETLRLPLLRGRDFTAAEDEVKAGLAPALINDRLGERLFGNEDPLGRQFQIRLRPGEPAETFVAAGIVPSVMQDLFDREARPHVYVPFGSRFRAGMTLHVATAPGVGDAAMLTGIQGEIRQIDVRLPILTARTMARQRDTSISQWGIRAAAAMFSVFGALALLLATIGVYGLKAYDVARRTREIGIRLALGATTGNVERLVLFEGLKSTVVGLSLGLLLAIGIGRLVSGLLYRVSWLDPAAIVGATVVLTGATLLAGYLPARRATRIAPLDALRTE